MPPDLLRLLSLSWVKIHYYMVRLLWLKAAQSLATGHVEIYFNFLGHFLPTPQLSSCEIPGTGGESKTMVLPSIKP